ncbi:MAG: glycosyltransferase [Opitutaceae bacterium]|nr:glycosyltransferase [Opitutaceae bacterium]
MDPSNSHENRSSRRSENESLDCFLASEGRLTLPVSSTPKLTIVIASWGSAEMLWASLRALEKHADCEWEAIIALERVGDGLGALLLRVDGLEVLEVEGASSFARLCNEGTRRARSAIILFLKEGVRIERNSFRSTLDCFSRSDTVGAVGGLLLDMDGAAIEAGSVLFSDGNCRGVGRGWNPNDYRLQYRRNVTFCSGARLAFRKEAFDLIGGFDESYSKEYYEDVDACLQLADRGFSVVYDPENVAIQESEYRGGWDGASNRMLSNREVFIRKWAEKLPAFPSLEEWNGEAVFEKAEGLRILWIEDSPPFAHMGAGFPRTLEMLSILLELGHSVTLLPTFFTKSNFEDVYRETPREVEVALGIDGEKFESFWNLRQDVYDVAILSRPNNLKQFRKYMEDTKRRRPSFRFIYDAEAVFANREISERRYGSSPFSEAEERALLEDELVPAKNADVVFAISETERSQFESLGFSNIQMLRHHSKIAPTPRGFLERRDILFVGAVHSDEAPNALGLIWFIENALPILRNRIGQDVKLFFAGKNHSKALEAYASDSERFLGFVEDLDEWYDRCRVFIAPARYTAGIPLKVIEASSRGIPVVGTDLAREQLGWELAEMLSAESAEAIAEACIQLYTDEALWERLREGALNRVARDYSRQSMMDALEASLA